MIGLGAPGVATGAAVTGGAGSASSGSGSTGTGASISSATGSSSTGRAAFLTTFTARLTVTSFLGKYLLRIFSANSLETELDGTLTS
ncbi:MAG: hypothetical protein ACREXY_23850, partial [Gammaproteobacteria bacterium]